MLNRRARRSATFAAALLGTLLLAPAPGMAAEPTTASPSCAVAVATTIQGRYDAVRDFAADFRQVTRAVALGGQSLGADAPSEGRVVFSKPGRMRWRYLRPKPSEVISNGSVLWIVDPKAGEAQRLPVTEGYLTGAALEFLLGDGKLLDTFDVAAPRCEADAEGLVELVLDPKQDASYERLRLWASPQTGDIVRTSLVDLFGNETTMSFSNPIVNQPAASGTFEFEPPAGMRVIDLTPGR